jgi:hypothetical protein
VSGGSRCNVTNRTVEPADFWGGPARGIKRVLHAFPASRTAAFFNEIGVPLHEEEDGKFFPDTNRSRTVPGRPAARSRVARGHHPIGMASAGRSPIVIRLRRDE